MRRIGVVAGHFSGTSIPVQPTYAVQIRNVTPGLRESIRDIRGEPTNCDMCKPWIGDIAAGAVAKGMKPYGWYAPTDAPAFAVLNKPLSECKVGMVSTSGCYVKGVAAWSLAAGH
eukprot:gnl/TRDRNA2_/TRDRNA2_157449_c0_seq2.p2 gnl/TRDRNA2_/TRDRNA2_157449_c0~~gnl/TRDRNA2_/TRDRNA2_157449_c0_seq2.p2  ORF type:complete len:115 (+),score=16.47 gnl/TRDRNA2_/TRDRNA2_157449_c0_seq2:81-425(+)